MSKIRIGDIIRPTGPFAPQWRARVAEVGEVAITVEAVSGAPPGKYIVPVDGAFEKVESEEK